MIPSHPWHPLTGSHPFQRHPIAAAVLGLVLPLIASGVLAQARDNPAPPAASAPAARAATGVATSAATPITRLQDAPSSSGAGDPVRFAADAKWEVAGYNDQEIVYTIIITSQDSRIIHCSAELHGFYFENGVKHSISDRQGTTIFPGKEVRVGHWLGMDQQSGATYKVSCRPM